MTTHTQACLESQVAINAKREAYKAQWPDHCPDCEGWGGHTSSFDPSPDGVSLGSGSYQEFDPCETCYCKGKCPRCGSQMADGQEVYFLGQFLAFPGDSLTMLLFNEDTPCPSCGFTEGTDGMQPLTECGCWYAEEDAYLKALDLYLDEPTTYWIFDNNGCRKWVGDEPMCFAVFPSANVDAEFALACQYAGLDPADHNYTIAS